MQNQTATYNTNLLSIEKRYKSDSYRFILSFKRKLLSIIIVSQPNLFFFLLFST